MTPTYLNRYLVLLALIVAALGTVGAGVGGHWDLLVVLALLDVLLLALAISSNSHRPPVPLRNDLVIWLRRRAARHGESLEAVADRAVASYRERLEPTSPPQGQ